VGLEQYAAGSGGPTKQEIEDEVTGATGKEPVQCKQSSSFYRETDGGEGVRGKMFAKVKEQPKLLFDPSAKTHVSGEMPPVVRQHEMVSEIPESDNLSESLKYQMEFDDEIPDVVQVAVEESYDMLTSVSRHL